MISKLDNKTLAVHLLRISFGINFLFHGIVRLPNLEGFVTGMQNTFQNTLLPSFLVTPLAYSIPFIELTIGILLLINKYTKHTLIGAFGLMNVLVIGSSFAQKWDLVGLQATYIGFLFLLFYFTEEKTVKTR
ncbi:DoxX family membrane protein [Winogradskyella eckloniae]|uniref:MauE/DoxX family redox-associated membrane protein n=1 Tax=Flavobacteriaceae TaxID=49546 RepID=UPI001563A7D5|nr:MauE/DoxX family redox-associated membrane protein [Winogradskyella eckloniae]NRD20109.1 DoxX family membrane protein [Winogradskyella eckloniae]